MHQCRIAYASQELPPIGVWCHVFFAGHEHIWLRGRLLEGDQWELDTREPEIPDRVRVDDELVTHWTEELPSPFDMRAEVGPVIVEGQLVNRPARLKHTRGT